mgnify:FL=1
MEWAESGERVPIPPRATAADWGESGGSITSRSAWEQPIRCEQDIERWLGETTSADSLMEQGRYDPVATLRRDLGDGAYLAAAAHGVFPAAMDALGGFEEAMLALRERPRLVRAVEERLAHQRSPILEAAARQGADGAWLGGYLEGADLIAPQVWREVALPGHRIQVEAARGAGLQGLFWFLGDAMPLLRDLAELGIDGLALEQPRRGYQSHPARVRDVVGAFVMGTTYLTSEANLGAVDHLCKEVVRVSREVGYPG